MQHRKDFLFPTLLASILSVTFLASFPGRAEIDDEAFEEERYAMELGTESVGEDLDELPGVDSSLTEDSVVISKIDLEPSENPGTCLGDYSTRGKRLLRRSLVNPAIAVPGVAGGTALSALGGAAIGQLFSKSAAWGSIAGSSYGIFIGFWGTSLLFTAREAILVAKYVDNLRMQALILELESENPESSRPMLKKLQEKIERFGAKMSISEIAEKVDSLNSARALCDGTLTGAKPSRPFPFVGKERIPPRKKLLSFRSLARLLATNFDASSQ